MDHTRVRTLSFRVWLSLLFASALPVALAAQATFNLFKEVSDKKAAIVWKDAPADALPSAVCNILAACNGSIKLIALPPATENGQKVGRALFIAEDAKKSMTLILERQTGADVYFFLVGPDGNLQKAAYLDLGKAARQWVSMGSSLGKPQFDKDKVIWHDRVQKLGAPAAAAPEEKGS